MKKFIALLLILLLAIGASGISVFADETDDNFNNYPEGQQFPVFVGGGDIFPLSSIPNTMRVGDTITFVISSVNFANITSFGDNDAQVVLAGLSVTGNGGGCFRAGGITESDGRAYFELVCTNISDSMTFTVGVAGPNGTFTNTYAFTTAIVSNYTPEDTVPGSDNGGDSGTSTPDGQGLEESSVSSGEPSLGEPIVSGTAAPVFIMDFSSGGSAPQIQNHTDTIYIGDDILFLVPDDNFDWSTGDGAKSYDLVALNNWASLKVVAPGNFTYKFVEYSGDLYLKLTAVTAGSVIAEPVGLDGAKTYFSVVIVDPNPPPKITTGLENGDGDDDGVDSFSPRTMTIITPFTAALAGPIDNTTTATATGVAIATSGVTDIAFYGVSDGTSIVKSAYPATLYPSANRIVLQIPVDNFIWGGTHYTNSPTEAEVNTLIANLNMHKDWITFSTTFVADKEFCKIYDASTSKFYIGIRFRPTASVPANMTVTLTDGTGWRSVTLGAAITLATANTNTKAIGITAGSELGGWNTWMTKNGYACSEDIDALDAIPGDEYLIYFDPGFFEWDNGIPAIVTLSQIRDKIKLRTTSSTNSNVMETIELVTKNGQAAVRIKFKSPQIIRNEKSFKATVYLTVSGRRDTDSEVKVAGTISNGEPEEYYSDDTDIDISDGIVGKAMETIRKVQVYIGEGVYINVVNLRKNATFYGVAVLNEDNSSDDDILDEYPDIVDVYTLYTAGLNGAGNTVEFDEDGNYYVYDSDLNYLGRSSQKLPYSQKYYFAIKELNVPLVGTPDIEEPTYGGEIPEGLEEGSTGGAGASNNGNYNPYTGR